jgi:hypothetical protein
MMCENDILKKIIIDTILMARRYADGRKTYAVEMVNNSIDLAIGLGIDIKDDHTLENGVRYATDGHMLEEK